MSLLGDLTPPAPQLRAGIVLRRQRPYTRT
jgi:hypothetical protein